ncbi:MAG: hypothetical protein WA484_13750, partial [Solirubrobacteraceae bacterium]
LIFLTACSGVCLRRFMIVSILPSHHGKHDHALSLAHFMGTPSVLAIAIALYIAARLIVTVLPVLIAVGGVVVIGVIIRLIFYHINKW